MSGSVNCRLVPSRGIPAGSDGSGVHVRPPSTVCRSTTQSVLVGQGWEANSQPSSGLTNEICRTNTSAEAGGPLTVGLGDGAVGVGAVGVVVAGAGGRWVPRPT